MWQLQATALGISGRAVMLIGVPKEIKVRESRVGLVPSSVAELTARGHKVNVETGAGAGIGLGLIGMAAAQAVGRNPSAFGNILTIGIIGMALAEAIAIYAFIMALQG